MIILPAIDLYEGKAVRLLKGDYNKMTVYDNNPSNIAKKFENSGARYIHLVDLEGAKTGETPNIDVVRDIVKSTSLSAEIGGGIRSFDTIEKYLSIGVDRVILGTAAVTEEGFVKRAISEYGARIVVGADIKDGLVAIKGWLEKSSLSCDEFCLKMQNDGVKTIIVTDISKDGAMQGTNHELYNHLSKEFKLNIIASGGVSSLDDIKRLKDDGITGAIIGKAYYTGAVSIDDAVLIAGNQEGNI
jgi:phosphoribosylformimino-5-aminoimidazole carboxamide ribotide isomerase